jgi:hypothetical protein
VRFEQGRVGKREFLVAELFKSRGLKAPILAEP